MRIGVFGGTFDPVHFGHLIVAEQCREQAQLDQVLFIPAARPPHKQDQEITPFARRAEMLELAIAGQKAFAVDEMEKSRPGPSYTADTLDELQKRDANSDLFLIVGMDCIPELATWRDPARIGNVAELLIVARPEWDFDRSLLPAGLKRWQFVQTPLIQISSRDLRQRISEGRSIRYMVPAAVEAYIDAHRLYRI